MPPTGPRKRRHHRRSRTGCVSCKARHMRCDEAKPFCNNCLRNGASCGYAPQSPRKSRSPSASVIVPEKGTFCSMHVASLDDISFSDSNVFDKIQALSYEAVPLMTNNCLLTARTSTVIAELAEELLSLATGDTALLHTVIVLASNYYAREECSLADLTYFSTHHRCEALRIINERLNNLKIADIDGTIAAVAAMALADITSGASETAIHHLNGLENLLMLRGNLQSNPLSGLVQRIIMVVDVLTAEATATELRFPMYIFGKDENCKGLGLPNETDFVNSSSPDLALSYDYSKTIERCAFSVICSIDWDSTKVFTDLHILSAELTANDAGTQFSEPSGLISRISAAQEHIDNLIHPRHTSTSTGSSYESGDLMPVPSIESGGFPARSWAIAGSIFVYRSLLRAPDGDVVFDHLVKALKDSLENEGSSLWETRPPERLLWALCIGACASGPPERPWFVAGISRVCEKLVIRTWAEAQECLEKLAWVNYSEDTSGSALWSEVTLAQSL